jgi:hypothetical protein
MARKITTTKAERAAVERVSSLARASLTPKEQKAWDSLVKKIQSSEAPPAPSLFTPGQFLEIYDKWPHATPVVEGIRTPAWYARISKALTASGMTPEDLPPLLEYVGTWAKYPMPPETILAQSAKWRAQAAASKTQGTTHTAPAGLFED